MHMKNVLPLSVRNPGVFITLVAVTSCSSSQELPQSTLAAASQTNVLAAGSVIETENPGFEGQYREVASSSDAPNAKAVIKGAIAAGWGDNSHWADVNIHYSRDTVNPHRGEATGRWYCLTCTSTASAASPERLCAMMSTQPCTLRPLWKRRFLLESRRARTCS